MSLEKLKSSNEEIAEAIRAGNGSDEDLHALFDAYEENRAIIQRMEQGETED